MRMTVVATLLAAGFAGRSLAAEPVDFAREIQPVLERACVQCHGPEKQKGKLRLDSREALLKGGENGAPITPGKPEESDFYHRVTLDAAHEDVMPPKGKAEHLTSAETELLKRWILEGASWPAGVIAVAKKDAGAAAGPIPLLAELAARAALTGYGVRIKPLASGVNWVRVNFRNVSTELPAEAWSQLGQLTNAVELDLNAVKITDEQLEKIAALPNLAVLNLSQTPITDAGLERLGRLEKLATLNLYGTQITDTGLAKLTSLAHLRRLYVADTGVTAFGVAALQTALPSLQIDSGNEFGELIRREAPAAPKP